MHMYFMTYVVCGPHQGVLYLYNVRRFRDTRTNVILFSPAINVLPSLLLFSLYSQVIYNIFCRSLVHIEIHLSPK